MARRQVNYKTIDGFKVISQWRDKNRKLRFTVICKVCGKEFDKAFSTLNKYKTKSCGCISSQLKTLDEYINGFRIIKSLGINEGGDQRVEAECKICKRIYEVTATKLRYNKSCGCLNCKGNIKSRYNKSHRRLMVIYSNMKTRCYHKEALVYKNYGARGITICDEWLNDSNLFCEWSLKNGYSDDLTIDRTDNDKGYSPDNCRWVTLKDNSRNTRCVIMSMELAREIRSSGKSAVELAKKYDIKEGMIYDIKLNRCWKED